MFLFICNGRNYGCSNRLTAKIWPVVTKLAYRRQRNRFDPLATECGIAVAGSGTAAGSKEEDCSSSGESENWLWLIQNIYTL